MKRIKRIAVAVILCAALTVPSFAANLGGGTVNASALNLRSSASTSSSILALAPNGASVVVQEKIDGEWYKVVYNGISGYMASEYINFKTGLKADFGTGTINATSVRFRSGASLSSTILGTFNPGATMKVTGVDGEWYSVNFNGTDGYVYSDYLTLSSNTQASSATTENNGLGEEIVAFAEQYLGTPYVWAGTSPSGFDCSGFVYYIYYKQYGYAINRSAALLYENGSYVEQSDLIPGDLVFFTNSGYSYIGHVGIYIGDGQFIHASSGSGRVIISDLDSTYYASHYYGARRIV